MDRRIEFHVNVKGFPTGKIVKGHVYLSEENKVPYSYYHDNKEMFRTKILEKISEKDNSSEVNIQSVVYKNISYISKIVSEEIGEFYVDSEDTIIQQNATTFAKVSSPYQIDLAKMTKYQLDLLKKSLDKEIAMKELGFNEKEFDFYLKNEGVIPEEQLLKYIKDFDGTTLDSYHFRKKNIRELISEL